MPIDWIYGLAGGFIIGLAGAVFLLMNGRVMGASGIIGGLVDGTGQTNRAERISFLLGLAAFPAVMALAFGQSETHATSNVALLVIAGLMVGIGTRLANGCTSGHGVCGISRLSLRGLVSTIFYILAGASIISLLRGYLGAI